MRVTYIAMKYPSKSETFLSSDVRVLKRLGVDVSISPLKWSNDNLQSKYLQHQRISKKCVSSVKLIDILYQITRCFTTDVRYSIYALLVIFNGFRKDKKFIELFKCIILIPSSIFQFRNIVKQRPNAVHLFWGHYPSLVGMLLNKFSSIQFTMFLGAYDLERSLGISVLASKEAYCVFTHAYCNLPLLNELGVDLEKVHVSHRGVDTALLNVEDIEIKPISHRSANAISAGRLIPSKRFDLVIDSFKTLLDNGLASKLLIFGDGPCRYSLEKQVSKLGLDKFVVFKGYQPQISIIKALSNSRFFLFHSSKKGERLPNVIKEAMYMGCVTISSFSPGIDELISNGNNGFILKSDVPLDLEFIRLLKKIDLSMISDNARDKIKSSFDSEKELLKYVSEWQFLVEQNER